MRRIVPFCGIESGATRRPSPAPRLPRSPPPPDRRAARPRVLGRGPGAGQGVTWEAEPALRPTAARRVGGSPLRSLPAAGGVVVGKYDSDIVPALQADRYRRMLT